MKSLTRKLALGLLSIILLFSLTGCNVLGTGNKAKTYTEYVQSMLDTSCKGIFDKYMELTESTQTQAQEVYDSTIEYFAYALAYYFDAPPEYLDEATLDEFRTLSHDLYEKTKYTVNTAEKAGDTYHVKVVIEPIDFLDITYDAVSDYITAFNTRVDAGEFNEFTDSEFEIEYAKGLLEVITPYVDQVGYKAEISKIVEIIEEETMYRIDEDLLYEISECVVGLE